MDSMQYVGLDIHKKTISYCVKQADGTILKEGVAPATRAGLDTWMGALEGPWRVAMEATLFTSWVYEYLKPHAQEVKVAHPAMLKAIAASKRKNDRVDAWHIADLLRCNLVPECYMAPREIRELRRTLRYRNLLVRQITPGGGSGDGTDLGSGDRRSGTVQEFKTGSKLLRFVRE